MRVPLPMYGGVDGGPRPGVRAQVHDALARGVDPAVVAERVGQGLVAVARALAQTEIPGELEPAWDKGCCHCCHQRVELTGPEVLLLCRWLRAYASEALLVRIAETARALAGLSAREHHLCQVRCALLADDGTCTAYEARPMACRRAHSTDAAACAEARREPARETRIPEAPVLSWNLSSMVLGYYEGAAHAGLAPHMYELHAALVLALARPAEDTLLGAPEDPLASARTRSAEDLPDVLGRAKGG